MSNYSTGELAKLCNVTTRRFECPNCHETHYCIEVPKAHMSTEQLEISHIQHNN